MSEVELIEFMQSKLARYKVPRYIIFLKALPETSAGEIAKRELQDKARKLVDKS